MNHKKALFLLVLPLLLLLAACSKPGAGGGKTAERQACRDLEVIPQDLQYFAGQTNANQSLMSEEEQSVQTERAIRQFFSPWRTSGPDRELGKLIARDFDLSPNKGYDAEGNPFSIDEWRKISQNANAKAFPSRSQHGITVRNTSLRAMPTNKAYFLNPARPGEGYPFDYFQQSALWIGTPVYICHVSKDHRWVFAQSNLAAGWLPAEDVAITEQTFMNAWRSAPPAAIIRDEVTIWQQGIEALQITGKADALTAHIGTILPMGANSGDSSMEILLPKRTRSGHAEIVRTYLSRGQAVPMPLKASPAAIANIGNQMIGQAYGWGGLDENRDCSSMMHDLFVPFGIWLPRNSRAQAASGISTVNLAGLDSKQKLAFVADKAVPFFSLIWMPGHIGLYVGLFEKKPVFFHNVWGMRTNIPGQDKPGSGRAVIGKAVITTLRPGAELPNISSPDSLLDRVEKVVNLPIKTGR